MACCILNMNFNPLISYLKTIYNFIASKAQITPLVSQGDTITNWKRTQGSGFRLTQVHMLALLLHSKCVTPGNLCNHSEPWERALDNKV